MRAVLAIFLVLVVGALVVGLNSVFTVGQTEQALVTRLGQPVAIYNEWGADPEPGLKFKLPFVENVVHLERRNLELDSAAREITAGDQQRLIVDAFARWRISDPLLFYQRLNNVDQARGQLEAILNTAVREVLGTVTSPEIVSGQRAQLMRRIQERMAATVSRSGFGVEIIDVKIRRVELPVENRERVFARMIAERNQEAQGIRAEGREEAAIIRAEADRQVRVIAAQANEQAQRIQGEGDARRNEIYAAAYNRDQEFFAFYRSMLAYEAAINQGTTMLLAPDSDFFSYFSSEAGRGGSGADASGGE
jgi:membrane protease subunit HflC